mgnify:CR=1 FL=1
MAFCDFFRKNRKNAEIKESLFETKRDGLTIRGTEYRPRGEKLPVAILSHGFMAWQDTVKHYARLLAQLGYAAFCFDFCGGSVMKGKSDGKTEEMSVLTEVQDLEAVMEYARSLDYVDPEKILLLGCSQGGFVSALVAAKNRYPVQKLCLIYPALCIPDDARAGKMMMARFDPENVPEILYCGPMKLGRCYPVDVMDIDPFEAISPFQGRVCIIHGDKDPIVKLPYSERAAEAYRSTLPEGMAEEDRVQLHVIKGGGHGFTKKQDKQVMEKIRAFVKDEE